MGKGTRPGLVAIRGADPKGEQRLDSRAGARMKIKLCGVRTVADALLCADEGADEIGVIFAASSRRRVTVQEAKAIRDALPARVRMQAAPL